MQDALSEQIQLGATVAQTLDQLYPTDVVRIGSRYTTTRSPSEAIQAIRQVVGSGHKGSKRIGTLHHRNLREDTSHRGWLAPPPFIKMTGEPYLQHR
jgi:hypothetical protein